MRGSSLMMLFLALVMSLQFISASEVTAKSNKAKDQSQIKIVEKKENFYRFEIRLTSGMVIKNIVLKHLYLAKEWHLYLKDYYNLEIYDRRGEKVKSINLKEYTLILDTLLSEMKIKFNDKKLSGIHTYLDMVDSTWRSVVSAVKNEAKKLNGVVKHKDKRIYKVIKKAAKNKERLKLECNILKKYGYKCETPGFELPAFKDTYLGKPWKSVIDDPDGGLKRGQPYSFDINK